METKENRISSGIKEFNQILNGGFIPERAYLVRGGPGTGKTTLGLHFLEKGLKNNEDCLLITMTEPKEKLKKDAENRGFDLNGLHNIDLSPNSNFIESGEDYNMFPSNQVEQKPIIEKITKKIKDINPDRLFFDGVIQLKYLSADSFQFRKQILSLIQFTLNQETTILLSSEASKSNPDNDLQFLADGVINLKFNQNQRKIYISKFRGSSFQQGEHSFELNAKGLKVFPKLKPYFHEKKYTNDSISAGVDEIDALLHGGIERGTTSIISGPSGVGKTTLGIQFMNEASSRGENSVVYTFEESKEILTKRSESINIPLSKMLNKNNLSIKHINPLNYSPDKFSMEVREDVEKNDASIVMIDSISGYKLAFQNYSYTEKEMIDHLHLLAEYLKNMGVTVILINEIKNITGTFRATDVNISYLADNIIFLRYLEMEGKLMKTIGVLKKRLSDFENFMRKFKITQKGIKVGDPLTGLRGILSGTPEFIKDHSIKDINKNE